MRHLDFKQPIFGSNYLEMTIMPLYGLIPAPGFVKIWFTKGGCDKFLRIFDAAKAQVAAQLKSGRMAHDENFNQRIRSGYFANNSAFQDPSDPTFVYVNQPEQTFQNTNQYYGDQQYFNNMQGQQIGGQQANQYGGQQQQGSPVPPGFANPQPHQFNQGPQMQHPSGPYQGQGVPIGGTLTVNAGQTNQYPVQGGQTSGNPNPFENYPAPPQEQAGQNPYAPGGQYPMGMNNPHAAYNNQPGVGYYFGVPIGPQVNRNH